MFRSRKEKERHTVRNLRSAVLNGRSTVLNGHPAVLNGRSEQWNEHFNGDATDFPAKCSTFAE